jgi:hypothetical protein
MADRGRLSSLPLPLLPLQLSSCSLSSSRERSAAGYRARTSSAVLCSRSPTLSIATTTLLNRAIFILKDCKPPNDCCYCSSSCLLNVTACFRRSNRRWGFLLLLLLCLWCRVMFCSKTPAFRTLPKLRTLSRVTARRMTSVRSAAEYMRSQQKHENISGIYT